MTDSGGPGRPPGATGRRSYRITRELAATPEAVWPLLAHAARWTEWSFLDRAGLEEASCECFRVTSQMYERMMRLSLHKDKE